MLQVFFISHLKAFIWTQITNDWIIYQQLLKAFFHFIHYWHSFASARCWSFPCFFFLSLLPKNIKRIRKIPTFIFIFFLFWVSADCPKIQERTVNDFWCFMRFYFYLFVCLILYSWRLSADQEFLYHFSYHYIFQSLFFMEEINDG